MKSISTIKDSFKSTVANEDYFALKVVYDYSLESTQYVGFYFGDTDLLEFSVDKNTHAVKKFQLVLCNHYAITKEKYKADTQFEECGLALHLQQHIECSIFNVVVYSDAVEIVLSDKAVSHTVKCGQALFGLTEENNLVSVSVTGMSESDISHVIEELQMSS